ncbi:MAG: HAMP domain-containing sensor histidine kinase [Gammaproteobacteria bacterium]|nr:HAMP domain-containing sensor histidine kinase [Gammaproteobacteria bacterium]
MPSPATHSLRRALLFYELAFLALVIVTGGMGGLWAYFWQQASREALRLNELTDAAQDIRAVLFQQIKDVALARLRHDPDLDEVHAHYYRRIQAGFNTLRRLSAARPEDYAIQSMQEGYGRLQADLQAALKDSSVVNRIAGNEMLDPRAAGNLLSGFEQSYQSLRKLLDGRLAAQQAGIARWNRSAPYLLPIPMLLACCLLFFSRASLRRNFVDPMRAIILSTERMSSGDLGLRLPVVGVTEVAQLAESVNRLAIDLAASRDAVVASERQAALGALVPVVAHNIRNPLAAIRASAQVLEHLDDPQEAREIAHSIVATVDRLGRWVSALVSYLHPLKPHLRPVAATTLLAAVEQLIAPRCAEKALSLVRAPWTEGVSVVVDSDLMEQALYGLLGNALEASEVGSTVYLGVAATPSNVVFSITDSAGGLPFRPESTGLEPGPTTKRFGTGLGIPVAFKVCQAHGWALEFDAAHALGTQVRITAPRSAPLDEES